MIIKLYVNEEFIMITKIQDTKYCQRSFLENSRNLYTLQNIHIIVRKGGIWGIHHDSAYLS
jgi:hypothetical protein